MCINGFMVVFVYEDVVVFAFQSFKVKFVGDLYVRNEATLQGMYSGL